MANQDFECCGHQLGPKRVQRSKDLEKVSPQVTEYRTLYNNNNEKHWLRPCCLYISDLKLLYI